MLGYRNARELSSLRVVLMGVAQGGMGVAQLLKFSVGTTLRHALSSFPEVCSGSEHQFLIAKLAC